MEGDRDMYRQFQDWCLRTYGDSGKTKTVTRKKYDRIVQLLNGSESSSTDNAKFKFWVKSKGFQLGISGEEKQVLYVPVKTADTVGMDEKVSLRQVAVVEDFFDIIYSMHVENGTSGEKTRKHAGQKRTYKAISETYAFLPREAVTRFLMSCSECQKRMHLNAEGAEHRENGKAPTLVTSIIDYNMPITMAYMKHMRLQLLNAQNDEEDSSLDSDEYDMSDSTRMSAVNSDLSSNLEDRMASPQTLHAQQDDDSTADSINGNDGVTYHALTTRLNHSSSTLNSNGKVLEQQEQPLNLSDCPLLAACHTDNHTTNGRSKYKILGLQDLKTETKDNVSKSPAHSYSSYDSGKNEAGGLEDVSLNRADEDEDDQDDQDDCEKAMEVDGAEAERLKAFNMFVRLFVDENLDRKVPISKQPKEKIQAIIESCRRQFPEYQEHARKRIRTYLKSCRRMTRSEADVSRPIPSHLTSAAAENILASACENESRNAAKRMRLDRRQDEAVSPDKGDAALLTTPASAAPAAQEVLYINGPTDLSMKKQQSSSASGSSRPQLNPTEVNAVRQLIAGYRESAAFLLRSADELESILLQQN